ncbi:hypothetical protein BCR34DRAFT_281147 [Clohesyomyces aquaticus]|uniref:Uncharacterized protein n=1 Tax=Clohesyomyces aquaticus TaxID=1231657 RepID=A0A1Y1ZRU9_9PLEO|nr:hypothetical protein BCR34DRAFT_281147 [Clohesyomyces aquaticus]
MILCGDVSWIDGTVSGYSNATLSVFRCIICFGIREQMLDVDSVKRQLRVRNHFRPKGTFPSNSLNPPIASCLNDYSPPHPLPTSNHRSRPKAKQRPLSAIREAQQPVHPDQPTHTTGKKKRRSFVEVLSRPTDRRRGLAGWTRRAELWMPNLPWIEAGA